MMYRGRFRERAWEAFEYVADIASGRRGKDADEPPGRLSAAIFLVKAVLLEAGKDERS